MSQMTAMMGMSGVRMTTSPTSIAQPMASISASGCVPEGGVTVRSGSGSAEPFDSSLLLMLNDRFAADISLCPTAPAALGDAEPSGTRFPATPPREGKAIATSVSDPLS